MAGVTTEQTVEVKLSPSLKKKLLTKLKAFAANKSTIDALEHSQKKIKAEIEEAFVAAGEFNALQSGVKIEGFKTTHVSPVSSRLDKKKLLEAGVSMAQIERATVTTPGKGYVKITVPGDKEDA